MIELDVSKALKRPGEAFHFTYSGMPELEGIELLSPLELQAEYSSIEGDIQLRGDFQALLAMECTRCLNEVEYGVGYSFDELYVKSGQAEDDNSYTFSGETVSLDKMVYDAIVLSIPPQLLCKEDCAGLCQSCGTNLNDKACKCGEAEEIDENNPFAKLKGLFDEDGGK